LSAYIKKLLLPMPTPTDEKLYAKAVRAVNKVYGTTTSAYRSMAIVKKYNELGGTYEGTKAQCKKTKDKRCDGTSQWLAEKWIQVVPFVEEGKRKKCGEDRRRAHACRPSVRINERTPITVQEGVAKHGKEKTLCLAKSKHKDTEKVRVDWNKGVYK
jgi:hypothetical protein